MFIGGRYVEFEGLDRTEIRDPGRQTFVGDAPAGGAEQADHAVSVAADAFALWRSIPAAKRGEALLAGARAVAARVAELAPLLTAEQGKPLHESRAELARFVKTLDHYAGLARSLSGRSVPDLDLHARGLVLKRPLGVVAAIVGWNYPTTLLANKLGPALITGNTVVAKPDESTPLVTLRIAEIMHAAGLPDGVFNVVTGHGETAGAALVAHRRVAKIAFTGSTPNGRQVMAVAASRFARVTTELGSSDPMIICRDADVGRAVSAASWARFFNCGQTAQAVRRIYAHVSVYDAVVTELVKKADRLVIGHGDAEGTQIGPMHSRDGRETIVAQLDSALASGGEIVVGGAIPSGTDIEKGWFFQPTIVVGAGHQSAVAVEDTFGPLLAVWPVADLDEAIARSNATPFGLGASVWTASLASATHAMESLDAGYTWVNSPIRVYDELPVGGVKHSGIGREHGAESLDHYQETKSVVLHD